MWHRSIACAATMGLCGCSFSAHYRDAINASDVFHRRMDSGEYAVIYEAAARGFQASGTRDQLMGLFERVNRKMGKCGEALIGFGGYQATSSGTFVSTTSSRMCAHGALSEQF